ncbi:MAG: carbamoyltransferase HypF [Eubacterium sp.]|nr:carbamoyltransferase HypF [Eubacterium sp.]
MTDVTAYRIRVYGIVQGVGFRPFTARLARKCGITGTVCNKGSFVEITAEGTAAQTDAFLRGLKEDAPSRSVILKMDKEEISPAGEASFRILRSEERRGDIFVSPDIATCKQCEKELFDPENRRYLHPFINCTACGPRVTILDRMPYDRVRTSMGVFPMCGICETEYTSPGNRRYHAQPVCCNDCGPELYVLWERDGSGRPGISGGQPESVQVSGKISGAEALLRTREIIRSGGIAAVKGIGGYHLCADASNSDTVERLRKLKNRPFKPFAVMMRDLDTVRRTCIVTEEQEAVLDGPNKPILLLRRLDQRDEAFAEEVPVGDVLPAGELPVGDKTERGSTGLTNDRDSRVNKAEQAVCEGVAPDNPYLGVMLPYAPVQMLLFSYPDGKKMPDALIMTSGNAKDTPICMNDEEAMQFLTPLCDIILSNNRAIRLRADDSVMNWFAGEPYMIRRSRGYAPLPVLVPEEQTGIKDRMNDRMNESTGVRKVLGIGGELKNAFCLAKGELFYLSPYIGNLTDVRGREALEKAVKRMEELLEIRPDSIVCDLHPRYLSAAAARKMGAARGIPVIPLQHHYAHVLSCMAENRYAAPVIGIAFDGTGYGTDGTVWGGEFLIADRKEFRRAGSLEPFTQTGGDLAPREGWRTAAALLDGSEGKKLAEALGVCSTAEYDLVQTMIRQNINAVTSTSAGRVFDAASAVLGLRRTSSSEGEASMVLQFAAEAYCETFRTAVRNNKETEGKRSGMHQRNDEDTCNSVPRAELAETAQKIEIERSGSVPLLARAERQAAGFEEISAGTDGETVFRLPVRWLLRALAERKCTNSEETGRLAYEFHAAMAELICRGAEICRRQTGLRTVALTGGVMQNTLLLGLLTENLEAGGFQVLRHHMVPANDGGIALGQAYYLPEKIDF